MALHQSIIDLYDEYTHKPLGRRVFLERLTAMAGSTAAASAALAVLEPNYARAAVVPEADPRIQTERIKTRIGDTELVGYLAAPKGASKVGAVIVVHENRGLNAHIEDVTRRLAVDGFVALGVDFLAPFGGTPEDADAARAMFAKITGEQVVAQASAAVTFLEKRNGSNGKVGAVGFCWGGGMVSVIAAREPRLDAGVSFYGVAPPADAVKNIKASMMLHYAGLDTRVNATMAGYDAALKAANVPHTIYVYEGVNHAFNNDTSEERYNKDAATLAWSRTVEFFRQTLGG
ncbi:dienelactone hydrolase family protein [Alsobacter sp. SYSU M60028]|uniref:Dienelactone hydrolase family protein n=1 Tax=Alsobacter ponti TaxID=2962936 RepID=A0ABT1LID8_9HYPH|nr:dienelactone hydrolase family protein [Alsobacter ponti]MCP8940716.1 dienelactone hydrolase family protein [Alsobacter ponti]